MHEGILSIPCLFSCCAGENVDSLSSIPYMFVYVVTGEIACRFVLHSRGSLDPSHACATVVVCVGEGAPCMCVGDGAPCMCCCCCV